MGQDAAQASSPLAMPLLWPALLTIALILVYPETTSQHSSPRSTLLTLISYAVQKQRGQVEAAGGAAGHQTPRRLQFPGHVVGCLFPLIWSPEKGSRRVFLPAHSVGTAFPPRHL